jgi:uncharacterized protein DUF3574
MPLRVLAWLSFLLAVLALLTGCAGGTPATAAPPLGAPGCQHYQRTELYFGTGRPGGQPPVSDQEFQGFVDAEITPRFPDGLTLLNGYGQWRDPTGRLAREQSKVLILLYPAEAGGQDNPKIEEIRQLYRQKFQQESVLRVDAPPECASF